MIFCTMQVCQLQVCLIKFANRTSLPTIQELQTKTRTMKMRLTYPNLVRSWRTGWQTCMVGELGLGERS